MVFDGYVKISVCNNIFIPKFDLDSLQNFFLLEKNSIPGRRKMKVQKLV